MRKKNKEGRYSKQQGQIIAHLAAVKDPQRCSAVI